MVNPKIVPDIRPSRLNITQVSVTVSKTIQVVQFEPVRVDVTQTVEILDDDKVSRVRRELYESTSKAVAAMMHEELKRWRQE
jgi:hypothetical protein